MLPHERDFFMARIKCGYIRIKLDNICYIYKPTKDLIYESEEVFIDTYNECLENGVLDEECLLEFLLNRKIWSFVEEDRLTKKIPEDMEKLKVEMFKCFNNKDTVKRLRIYLNKAKQELYNIFEIKHQYDYLSCLGAATYSRWQFLAENCVSHLDGSKVDFKNISVHDILEKINQSSIEESNIRYLSRNDPWQSIWIAGRKGSVFGPYPSDYTEEQKRLISWSIMYDNIREREDCPDNDVFDDDDCFDGWMILTRRLEKEKSGQDEVEKRIGNSNAQEIFLPVKNQYNAHLEGVGLDPEAILSMNNPLAKNIIESRIQAINEHGNLKVADLPDIKMTVGMQANNAYMQKVTGK